LYKVVPTKGRKDALLRVSLHAINKVGIALIQDKEESVPSLLVASEAHSRHLAYFLKEGEVRPLKESCDTILSEYTVHKNSFVSALQRAYAVSGEQYPYSREKTTLMYLSLPSRASQGKLSVVATNSVVTGVMDYTVKKVKCISPEFLSYVVWDADAADSVQKILKASENDTAHCVLREDKSLEIHFYIQGNSVALRIPYVEGYTDRGDFLFATFHNREVSDIGVLGKFYADSETLYKNVDLSATKKKAYRKSCYFKATELLQVNYGLSHLQKLTQVKEEFGVTTYLTKPVCVVQDPTGWDAIKTGARFGFQMDILRIWFAVQDFAGSRKKIKVTVCSHEKISQLFWGCLYTDKDGLRSEVYMCPYKLDRRDLFVPEKPEGAG
jgi:hypothetical protein